MEANPQVDAAFSRRMNRCPGYGKPLDVHTFRGLILWLQPLSLQVAQAQTSGYAADAVVSRTFHCILEYSRAHFGSESPSRRCVFPSHEPTGYGKPLDIHTFRGLILWLQPRSTHRGLSFGLCALHPKITYRVLTFEAYTASRKKCQDPYTQCAPSKHRMRDTPDIRVPSFDIRSLHR